jgi:N-acetyl-anhydromuramyl-L-alanine amidase AmpD
VNLKKLDARSFGWYPASSMNYAVAYRPSSNPIAVVIVHVAQAPFTSVINWFQNPSAKVSAHYTIRSSDGFIAQSVREQDIARHAGNPTYNEASIGIEHEGYVDDATSFTEVMYRSSAMLTAYLARKYGIPADRRHIIGHDEVPNPCKPGRYGGVNGHGDPGPHFDWEKYMNYIYAVLGEWSSSP